MEQSPQPIYCFSSKLESRETFTRIGFLIILFIFMVSSGVSNGAGTNFWVSAGTGLDTNPGTHDLPFKTIQKGVDNALPGSVIHIMAGTYVEQVNITSSGSQGAGHIVLKGEIGNPPVIDGTTLTVPGSDTPLILINGSHYITIKGLILENYRSTNAYRVPMGIFITSNSHDITIEDNTIRNIETNHNDGNAHGIAVYGTHISEPISNIIIKDNTISDLVLGASEALVLNGNVSDFTITGNHVYNCNNIAIDAIGYEGVCANDTLDRARNGTISFNRISLVSSYGNPAYGNEYAAGGIYVDGGTNIIIEGNIVDQCDIGVEIASEHSGKSTDHIIVRSNLLYDNHLAGIAMGGYDTGRGSTDDCAIIHNTLYSNDGIQSYSGELLIQFDTNRNTIINNIIYANAQGLFIGNHYTQNSNNVVDYNLYYFTGGASFAEWVWKKVNYTGFSAYQAATGNDFHSIFMDPQLRNISENDFHITSSSKAKDKGIHHIDAGALDIDRQPRVMRSQPDIGSDEYPFTSIPSILLLLN